MSRSRALAAAAAIAAVVLTACSSGEITYTADSPYGGVPQALTPPEQVILSANSTADLGTVVVDGLGFTLYRFDEDSADPPESTCVDACAATWPPVLDRTDEPPILEQVDESVVDTFERQDGTTQVTINGWPVYRHAADPAPGDLDGHGVDDAWFAITPDGEKAEAL